LDLKAERRVSDIATGMDRYHNSVKEKQTPGDCVKCCEIPQLAWCSLEEKWY